MIKIFDRGPLSREEFEKNINEWITTVYPHIQFLTSSCRSDGDTSTVCIIYANYNPELVASYNPELQVKKDQFRIKDFNCNNI